MGDNDNITGLLRSIKEDNEIHKFYIELSNGKIYELLNNDDFAIHGTYIYAQTMQGQYVWIFYLHIASLSLDNPNIFSNSIGDIKNDNN